MKSPSMQDDLNEAYRPLLDQSEVFRRLAQCPHADWPDAQSIVRELNGPFLIAAHEQYQEAKLRVVIVGQENNDWGPYKSFADFHQAHPANLASALDEYRKFITRWEYNTTFFQYFARLRKEIHGEQASEQQQSILWLNLFKLNHGGKCSWKSPLYEQMLAIQAGVFQAEIKALDPHVVIFLTGPDYDQVIERFFPQIQRATISPFEQRQVMRISAPGLPRLTFRSYHPGYVHRQGEAGWDYYGAIVNHIRTGTSES